MKRTGFRRLTYAEAQQKQDEARQRARARHAAKSALPKPLQEKKVPPKKDRVKTLKRKLWEAFSRYIRKSHADSQTGYVMTCDGKLLHWKETHCGHLFNNSERSQSLGGNALWYDERNFAPQSSDGNYFNAGDSAKKYMMWAVRKYGIEAVEEMQRLKQIPRQFTEQELEEKLVYYKEKFDRL